MLKHVADRCGPAWQDSLLATPSVDLLDQLRLDADVDICGFPFHAGELGRFPALCLIISGQKIAS
jgi:hypothetical protein